MSFKVTKSSTGLLPYQLAEILVQSLVVEQLQVDVAGEIRGQVFCVAADQMKCRFRKQIWWSTYPKEHTVVLANSRGAATTMGVTTSPRCFQHPDQFMVKAAGAWGK